MSDRRRKTEASVRGGYRSDGELYISVLSGAVIGAQSLEKGS